MKNLITVLIFTTLLASCGEDEVTPTTSSSPTTVSTFTEVFSAISNGISSAGEVINEKSRISNLMKTTCSNGEPAGDPTASTYPEALYNCQMNTNSKNPDTNKGAFYVVYGLICILEENASVRIPPSEAVTIDGITVSETDSCWGSGGFDTNDDGDTEDSIVVSAVVRPTTEGDFNYYVGLQLSTTHSGNESEDSFKAYMLMTSDAIGFRVPEYDETDATTGTYYQALMTTSNLFWENQDLKNKRHTRIKVDGTYDLVAQTATNEEQVLFIWSSGDEDNSGVEARRVVMSSQVKTSAGWNSLYDHYVGAAGETTTKYGDSISAIPYDVNFISFSGKVMPTTPESDPLMDLSDFDMSWE